MDWKKLFGAGLDSFRPVLIVVMRGGKWFFRVERIRPGTIRAGAGEAIQQAGRHNKAAAASAKLDRLQKYVQTGFYQLLLVLGGSLSV